MLLVLLAWSCKKSEDLLYSGNFSNLQGKWELVATESGALSGASWYPVSSGQVQFIYFRSDGVLTDSAGLPACCSPKAYIINNKLFDLNPDFLPDNPACKSIKCAICQYYDIQISGNEMIVTPCNEGRKKYVRR